MRVLISDPIDDEGVKILSDAGFTVDNQPGIDKTRLASIINQYDALIVRGRTKVDAGLIGNSKLKIVGRAGVGLDNIDLQAAKEKGVTVLNTPSAPTTSVAELTVGLMLCLLRKIPFADHSMKEGRWIKSQLMGEELQSKKIGIIGRAGRIGNEVSRILTVGFQAYVLGYDVIRPRGVPGLSYEITDSIEDLLQRCDIVTIHVPYSPQTHHLLNEARLRMMRKGSYLVNTSRGDIVEGSALLRSLKEGQIGGAGLDVFHLEPPVDEWERELVNLPNGTTVVTCHIGAETRQAQKRASIEIAERIRAEVLRLKTAT
ncbi:MAG TPA: hydroxyacid dehydrogenase [Candidatus Limnocylindrales bacterium]|nr:hydroxyacid dehydrogenase [Candidatus Limnocylindrales bacterium]